MVDKKKLKEFEEKRKSRLNVNDLRSVIYSEVNAYFDSVQTKEQFMEDLDRPVEEEGDTVLIRGIKKALIDAVDEVSSEMLDTVPSLNRKINLITLSQFKKMGS